MNVIHKARGPLLILATVLFLVALLTVLAMAWIVVSGSRYSPGFTIIPFDEEQWRANPAEVGREGPRLKMASDFLARQLSAGKTRQEIEDMLGRPDVTPYDDRFDMVYLLGSDEDLFFSEAAYLVFEFDEAGRVADNYVYGYEGPFP